MKNGEGISLEVKMELKDYIRFSFLLNRRFLITISVMIALFIIGLSVLLFCDGFPPERLPRAAQYISTSILILGAFYYTVYRRGKRFWLSGGLAQEVHQYTITDSGITHSLDPENPRIGWEKIDRVIDSKYLFCFCTLSNKAYIIPRRYFKDDNEFARLKKIFARNLPGDKKIMV